MKTIQQLCVQYGTDKTPEIGHSYAPVYDKLFTGLDVENLLEIGIGCPATMEMYVPGYQAGASLLVWRDYFPKAWIWGLDIEPTAMINAERITTVLGNSTDPKITSKFIREFDVIIDDGSHDHRAQLQTARNFLPLVKPGGLYFIEDVSWPDHLSRDLANYQPERLTQGRGDTLLLLHP